MILATHALTGAAIGKNIANPLLIIAISLTAHFIMDSFRHGEYFDSRKAKIKDTWWKVALDLSAGLSVILVFIFSKDLGQEKIFQILLGAFVSMFPDSLTLLYWKFHWNFLAKLKKFHEFAHHYSKFPQFSKERQWTLRNAANDLIISATAIILLLI